MLTKAEHGGVSVVPTLEKQTGRSLKSRPACATDQVQGQPRLQNETQSLQKEKQQQKPNSHS